MPIMDGHEATRQLRMMGVKTPIIALTGNALQSDKDLFFEAGVDDFQTKPLSRDKLVQLLARYGIESSCVEQKSFGIRYALSEKALDLLIEKRKIVSLMGSHVYVTGSSSSQKLAVESADSQSLNQVTNLQANACYMENFLYINKEDGDKGELGFHITNFVAACNYLQSKEMKDIVSQATPKNGCLSSPREIQTTTVHGDGVSTKGGCGVDDAKQWSGASLLHRSSMTFPGDSPDFILASTYQ